MKVSFIFYDARGNTIDGGYTEGEDMNTIVMTIARRITSNAVARIEIWKRKPRRPKL